MKASGVYSVWFLRCRMPRWIPSTCSIAYQRRQVSVRVGVFYSGRSTTSVYYLGLGLHANEADAFLLARKPSVSVLKARLLDVKQLVKGGIMHVWAMTNQLHNSKHALGLRKHRLSGNYCMLYSRSPDDEHPRQMQNEV